MYININDWENYLIVKESKEKSFPIIKKDSNGNVIYREESDGYWEKWEYDSNGNCTYFGTSNGYWWKSEYDSNGNEIYYEHSNGYWKKTEYDSNGNEIYHEDSNGYWRKAKFDSNGNKIYFEDSNGNEIYYDKRNINERKRRLMKKESIIKNNFEYMENNIKVGDKVTVVALDITEPGIPETEIFQIGELLEISTFDKTIKNNPDAFISIDDMDDENIITYNVDGEWYYQDMDILIRHFKEGDVETKNNEFTEEMKNWTNEELINNLRGVVNKSTNWELWIKNHGEEMIEEVISRSIYVEDWMEFQGGEDIEKPENDNISKTFDQDFDYTIKEQKLYTSINEFKRYLNK